MADITVVALVGSLRAGSVNRQLAEAASEVAPSGVRLEIYEGLDQLPFYNEDLDTPQPPESVAALRAAAAGEPTVMSAESVLSPAVTDTVFFPVLVEKKYTAVLAGTVSVAEPELHRAVLDTDVRNLPPAVAEYVTFTLPALDVTPSWTALPVAVPEVVPETAVFTKPPKGT